MNITQENVDKMYRKGIITSWEHELATWQVSGKITQEERERIIHFIYEDVKERFEPK